MTWEEYKKVYEADLDFTGKKQMHEYRAGMAEPRSASFVALWHYSVTPNLTHATV